MIVKQWLKLKRSNYRVKYINTEACAQQYRGRFAPSPSGPLHFGSLVCALASYLHAKQHNGKWLLRIEDIDTPRVDPHATTLILQSLHAHGLRWDEEIVYQSQRTALYEEYLDTLHANGCLYACECTRKEIRARGNSYDGFCRTKKLSYAGRSTRFVQFINNSQFTDIAKGDTYITHPMVNEDPVLKRADGIFCYHLAVVVDDIEQNITHIVRGGDLLETTSVHLSLYQAFKKPAPDYMHIPIVVHKPNEKLSKQNLAPTIDNTKALENLKLALVYLGISAPKTAHILTVEQLLAWANSHWRPNLIPKQTELLISMVNGVYLPAQNMAT